MKHVIPFLMLMVLFTGSCKKEHQEEDSVKKTTMAVAEQKKSENIFQFEVTDLYGEPFDFSSLKGKKIMVVNTASECGLTPQYAHLQKLYETYKDNDFIIVGFPANNFGSQEPGSDKEIAAFCKQNYGVTFPMMSKISVKGNDMHELYHFLTEKKRNGLENSEVAWNFQKYLLDEEGQLVRVVAPQTLPTDESIISWIEKN